MRPFESLTWCNLSYIWAKLRYSYGSRTCNGIIVEAGWIFSTYRVTIIIVNGILFVGTRIILLNDIIIRLDVGYMIHESFDFRYIRR